VLAQLHVVTVARIEIHFAWYFNHIGIFRVSPPPERKGLSIISGNEPDLCSEDPSRVLMRQMLGAFFQYEKTLLVAKLRGARIRKRATEGRCEGRKPYGEREGEAATIERIQSLRDAGMMDRDFPLIAMLMKSGGPNYEIGSATAFWMLVVETPTDVDAEAKAAQVRIEAETQGRRNRHHKLYLAQWS
jgi:hypothetical protein